MNEEEWASRVALLQPVRLRLEVPLEGPYTRLLRRPAPEVEALGQGKTIALVRASRIREPVPLWPAAVSCYYSRKEHQRRLSPEDFHDPDWARNILESRSSAGRAELHYLVVPVGHIRLPGARWVSALVARLTPWCEKTVERWRSQVNRNVWLSAVRLYSFDKIVLDSLPQNRPQPRILPLRLAHLRPVIDDAAFEEELDSLLEALGQTSESTTSRYSRPPVVRVQEEKEPYNADLQPDYGPEDFAAETGFGLEKLQDWVQRLQRKKQVVLYGPPGTGKTFVAERLARRLSAGSTGFWELIQFHPSYAYEDFIQGIRPQTEGGGVVYELVEGRFLEFCRRARNVHPESPCVLIIDEINRAHLSRVFGELMYLLEYRERAIPLAAGGESFKIPPNVYLIGTMNTADRSIALVDQALRRRFAFIRLEPDCNVLGAYLQKHGCPAQSLVAIVREINHAISDPDYGLGISFFMKDPESLKQVLPQIWMGEIEPYLEEVFYDQPEKMEGFRWNALSKTRLDDWV